MFKSSARYRPWEGYLLLVVIVIACILGIFQWLSKGDVQTEIPVLLTQETCKASGGIWNECGSACRGDQVDACMEVCVEYCEC
ncbi:hypothetical protein KJ766_00005, partial [Patescibacteria group bacterium]|nr:hypothetical protein [Patescibacteria group bacterium]